MEKALMLGLLMAGMVAVPGLSGAADQIVSKGKVVKFDYTLTVDGKEVESSKGKQPLEYTQGDNQIIVGLEKALEGMKVGEEKTVVVKPEEGYGEVNNQLTRDFDKAKLPNDLKPEVDMILEMQDPQGNSYPARISKVNDKSVTLDFNHPLAGKELTFNVKIVSVEDAKADAKPSETRADAPKDIPAEKK